MHAIRAAHNPVISSRSRIVCQASTNVRVETGDKAVKLPDLDYDYAAIEPSINAEIMELHHSKHAQTYANNYNNLLEQTLELEAKGDKDGVAALEKALHFNGWGTCTLILARTLPLNPPVDFNDTRQGIYVGLGKPAWCLFRCRLIKDGATSSRNLLYTPNRAISFFCSNTDACIVCSV